MAKRIACWVLLLMVASLCYAGETPRESAYSSPGKTSFCNLELTGLNNDGDGGWNPGTPSYIEMANGSGSRFYLWIGTDGLLRIASEVAVGHGASPSSIGWENASGLIVGGGY